MLGNSPMYCHLAMLLNFCSWHQTRATCNESLVFSCKIHRKIWPVYTNKTSLQPEMVYRNREAKRFRTLFRWFQNVEYTASMAKTSYPRTDGDFFLFNTLTGLRSSEAVNCIGLIRKKPEALKRYYNAEGYIWNISDSLKFSSAQQSRLYLYSW